MKNREFVEENESDSIHPYSDYIVQFYKKDGKIIYAIYDTDEENIISNLIHVSEDEFEDEDDAFFDAVAFCDSYDEVIE